MNDFTSIQKQWCIIVSTTNLKATHQIKCSDQFSVNTCDTDCFEHRHEENTKPSVNVSVSHAWIFSMTPGFYGFHRGEGRSDRTLINRAGMLVFLCC